MCQKTGKNKNISVDNANANYSQSIISTATNVKFFTALNIDSKNNTIAKIGKATANSFEVI